MVVRSIGNSLMVILPDLVGKKITNWFDLVRPLIAFKFQTVCIKAYSLDVRFLAAFDFPYFELMNRTLDFS